MGKGEKESLSIFIENSIDIQNFSHLTEEEFIVYCIEESELIVKELKINEIQQKFIEFNNTLQTAVYKLKISIYCAEESNKLHGKVLLKSLKILRDRIDSEFRHNHSSVIDWHKPNTFEKHFLNSPRNKSNFNDESFLDLINPKRLDKSSKVKKTAIWHYIFIEIIKGNIIINKIDNFNTEFFYKQKKLRNVSDLGTYLAEILNIKKASCRPIVSASYNGGTKEFFLNNNLKVMYELINEHGNQMCAFYSDKFNKLI